MIFDLTPEQAALRDEFRWFARTALRPFAAQAGASGEVPAALLARPEIANVMRIYIPLEFGGGWRSLDSPGGIYDLAGNAFLRVLAMEEGGYGDAPLFAAMPGPSLAAPIVRAWAPRELQQRLFSMFVDGSGPRWAAFAMTEPQAGSDVTALSTSAVRDENGWVLNGTKWFIGGGALASWVVVFATTNPRLGRFGLQAFLVERGTPGFHVGRRLRTDGFRAMTLSELKFEHCRIPHANALSPPITEGRRKSSGFDGGMRTFQQFRPAVAALGIGAARSALEYAREILSQNGARHSGAHSWNAASARLEELETTLHAARLLCWRAAWLLDQGNDATREISMAKAASATAAIEVCSACLDLAGRAALAGDAPLEKLFRDAKAFDLLEGTGDMHRFTIARCLLRGRKIEAPAV
jgi:acyl-CoA dehydrogenase